ncbi:lipocalin family protein [Flavobacterium restrictum]|uniref:Lipocalin-like domain-containing protein n=1 Tax=Flavobacterium restrictum TaxID=2594428 RepID=A0A553DSK7_9FLAO|nr:lipocalin family protein [Flavobacterium restrictum]TRX35660.1 hypothetical protein FNW21_14775 [Flavobacterium restrictum]
MKRIGTLVLVALLCMGCSQKIRPADVAKLNGYWEIEKVVFEQGKDKEYGLNESYDYFEIGKNNTGFRKKVLPQLNGTFLVNDAQEKVTVRFTADTAFLDYATPYAKWSEEILALSASELVVLNAEKKEYHYKKTGPINLTDNGKKTK